MPTFDLVAKVAQGGSSAIQGTAGGGFGPGNSLFSESGFVCDAFDHGSIDAQIRQLASAEIIQFTVCLTVKALLCALVLELSERICSALNEHVELRVCLSKNGHLVAFPYRVFGYRLALSFRCLTLT